MLPEDIFDPLLSSITVHEPDSKEGYACYEAIPLSFASDETTSFPEAAVRLWYRSDGNILFGRFIERLKSELQKSQDKDDQAVIGALLTLFAIHPQRRDTPTAILNGILSEVVDGDLSQFFVLPHPPYPGFQDFRIGQFSIGVLDSRKLGYRSSRAGSDYFERYGDHLRGQFAIERDITPARVFDLNRLFGEFQNVRDSQAAARLWNRSVESYFKALSAAYFEDFWEQLMEQQHLLIAMGSSYMDERNVRAFPIATPISVFMNINGIWGHVAPEKFSGLTVDFASLDRKIPLNVRLLRDQYNIEVGASLQPTLRIYSHFLSKAKRYLDQLLFDESFLHYVIALELLFGERAGTSESVSRRVGTLVFRPLGLSIIEARRRLEKLYDARSRYVHAGAPVEEKLLDEIKAICTEVLHALLRHLRDVSQNEDQRGQWLKDIDYVFSALMAGKSVVDQEFVCCGIVPGQQ